MKIIKVLILDDMKTDYDSICGSVINISNRIESRGIKLIPFYETHSESKILIANYVAYKNEPSQHQDVFKEVVQQEVEKIKNEGVDLVSIIDIRWNMKSGEQGCDFYCDYHSCFNDKNTAIVTIVNKRNIPDKIKDIETLSKGNGSEPFGAKFEQDLEKIILNMPIVRDNLKQERIPELPR